MSDLRHPVGDQARALELDALCRRIADFGRLPNTWAAEDGLRPGPDVIEFACDIIRQLPAEVMLPQTSPSADGEIGLSWFNGQERLEAMLHPDGHLVWVKRLEDRLVPGRDIDLHQERRPAAFFDEVVHICR